MVRKATKRAVEPQPEIPALPVSVYSVVGPVPVELVKGLRAADGEDCFGLWLPDERRIKINADADPIVQWLSLWHEWVHAQLWHAGVSLPKKPEEAVCNTIAAALAAMLLAEKP